MGRHSADEPELPKPRRIRKALKSPKNMPCSRSAACKAKKHRAGCPMHSSH